MAESFGDLLWQVLREHFPEGSARVILHRAEQDSGAVLQSLEPDQLARLVEALKQCATWAARSQEHAREFRADLDLLQRRELSTTARRPSSVPALRLRPERDVSPARPCVRQPAEPLGGRRFDGANVTPVVTLYFDVQSSEGGTRVEVEVKL